MFENITIIDGHMTDAHENNTVYLIETHKKTAAPPHYHELMGSGGEVWRFYSSSRLYKTGVYSRSSRTGKRLYVFIDTDDPEKLADNIFTARRLIGNSADHEGCTICFESLTGDTGNLALYVLSTLGLPIRFFIGDKFSGSSGGERLMKLRQERRELEERLEKERTADLMNSIFKQKRDMTPVTPNESQIRASEEFCSRQLIAAEGCCYGLDDIRTKLNNNVLIVGGAGTGKTRHVVTPNIHEAAGSYFICDPKGQLFRKYAPYLKKRGYSIRLIDFTHPERSDGYNPMDYVYNTQDVMKLAAIITDAKESEGTKCDPYWDRMTVLLISSLIAYLFETDSPDRNFAELLRLVRLGERDGDSDSGKDSKLRTLFQEHKKRFPDSWACEKFESVDTAPHRTFDTIRSTVIAKFSQLDSVELRHMMEKERFDFTCAATEKTAVFVTVSDTDRSLDTLVNLFFSQAMNELCTFADDRCDEGRLPIPVRFILDDFATNCRIEEFPRMISSIRSRGLSVMLMIQAESQLRQGYGYDAQTIISNCDTYVYLGGNDVETASAVSARCDRPMNEVLNMPLGRCWVFRRGSEPVFSVLTEIEQVISDMEH